MKHDSEKRRFNIEKDERHLKVSERKMLIQTSCARKLYYSQISGIGNNNKLIFRSEHLILQFITNQEEIKLMKIKSTLNYHVLRILKNLLLRAAIFLTYI